MIEMRVIENKGKYENYIKQQKYRIKIIEQLYENSPNRCFLITEINLHTSFIKLKYVHEIKGANQVIKAYKILIKNALKFTSFLTQQKSLGILHFVVGSMLKKHK